MKADPPTAAQPATPERQDAETVETKKKRVRQRYLLRRLLALSARFWPDCVGLVLLQGLMLALGLAGLGGVGLAIDYLRSRLDPTAPLSRFPMDWHPPASWSAREVVIVLGVWIVVVAALRGWLTYLNAVLANKLGQGRIVVELRSSVYARMQQMDFRFFDANTNGALINRVTGDTQSVRLFIDGVVMQAVNVCLATVIYLVFLVQIHAGLAMACLSTLPFLWLIVILFSRWLQSDYEEGRLRMDAMVRVFEELTRGVAVIKSFGLQPWADQRFCEVNAGVRDQRRSMFLKLARLYPTVSLLNQVSMMILLGYGGWLAIHDRIPIGTGLVVFAGILQQLAAQVNTVGAIADNLQQTLTGADRVYEILDTVPTISDRPGAAALGRTTGAIAFEDVTFRYTEGNTVLHHINFTVAPGEKIAIVGPTGSGKSALIQLIPRFYDPDTGVIRLDGRDLREWRLTDVRRQVGLVFQESFLFRASIAANISFGNPGATMEQIETAARLAVAHEFISSLPLGYDTLLHENGSNLSGGQRQRLSLSRAILLDPGILLLDDPTAAVDAGTEEEILDAVESVCRGRTTFIVAHRFSTVKRADRIIVMEKGAITAIGTHETLSRVPGYYRDAVLAEKGGHPS